MRDTEHQDEAPPATDTCVHRLKALADPTRLGVLELLLGGSRTVGELGERLVVEQSLLSHHLRVLRDHALVTCRRRGRSVIYALADEVDLDGTGLDLGCCRLDFPPGRST